MLDLKIIIFTIAPKLTMQIILTDCKSKCHIRKEINRQTTD